MVRVIVVAHMEIGIFIYTSLNGLGPQLLIVMHIASNLYDLIIIPAKYSLSATPTCARIIAATII